MRFDAGFEKLLDDEDDRMEVALAASILRTNSAYSASLVIVGSDEELFGLEELFGPEELFRLDALTAASAQAHEEQKAQLKRIKATGFIFLPSPIKSFTTYARGIYDL